MNENDFIKEINEIVDGASIDGLKAIIKKICKDIPNGNYYKTLCRIKNIKNNDQILIDNIKEKLDEICKDFKKVQDAR